MIYTCSIHNYTGTEKCPLCKLYIVTEENKELKELEKKLKELEMTKENFLKRINEIKQFLKEQDEFQKHFEALAPGSYAYIELGNKLLSNHISLLSEAVGDKCEWISWFVFECQMGKTPLEVEFKNGKKINVSKPQQLWRIINEK